MFRVVRGLNGCVSCAKDSLFIWCDLRVVIVLRLKIEDIVVVKEDIEIICLEESRGLYLCYECTCVACLGLLLCT